MDLSGQSVLLGQQEHGGDDGMLFKDQKHHLGVEWRWQKWTKLQQLAVGYRWWKPLVFVYCRRTICRLPSMIAHELSLIACL